MWKRAAVESGFNRLRVQQLVVLEVEGGSASSA
jgi:hypothetical protein